MDGYAVRREDLEGASAKTPVRLRVAGTVRAGSEGRAVKKGEAAKIMTGAPVPDGADAVVMLERVEAGANGSVAIAFTPKAQEHIRARGEDVKSGEKLLAAGTALRPYEAALIAAQGIAEVPVVQKPRVVILASGDELIGPGEPLGPGQIRNSNGPAVSAALYRWGIAADDQGIVRDDPRLLKMAFLKALEADVVLVSGGVSVGDFDHTKPIMEELGVKEVFWKVAIKPGKPLYFGVFERKGGRSTLVFGLPGNPISVLVTLEEFVRPALEGLEGRRPGHPSYHMRAKALNAYPASKERQQFLFCKARPADGGFEVEIIRPQGSAMMGMASRANALAKAPWGAAQIKPGDTLEFRWLK
jgi:molybdopterin molybdotransferase